MNWLPVQTVAQISVEHIFNVLPAVFVIAFFAWGLLRALRRQNSGTRFAVWFLALLTIAALPFLSILRGGRALALHSSLHPAIVHPAITIPERWALFIFIAWAAGASIAMMRLAAGVWRLRRLRQCCTAINVEDLDPAVQKTVDAIRAPASSGLYSFSFMRRYFTRRFASKPITIAVSEDVRVPSAIGFLNRIIVLPAWALIELSPEDLNIVLLHEFAHLRRGDDWTNLIQKIVRALFFFHPAVWWIENRLSVEREMACDDAVLAETANPHGYATCLVSLLEKNLAHRGLAMAQAAVHRAREASLRLAQILSKNRPVATKVWTPAVGMVGIFSAICLAALPHAPQLLAFDHATENSRPVYVASASRQNYSDFAHLANSANGAPGVPARLDLSTSLGTGSRDAHPSTTSPHNIAEHVAGLPPAHAAVTNARVNAAAPRPRFVVARAVEARATADPKIAPQFQTVVFINMTQYSVDSPVLVRVWQVTWITMPQTAERAPVANSI
jgi:Zn-dependent protease with chaperone function